MTPTIWTLDIPGWHPTPINQLIGNRFKANRLKKHDYKIVGDAAAAYCVLPAKNKRHVHLTLIYPPKIRAVDPDASWKSLLDACVACRILFNDSRKWVSYDEPVILRGSEKRCIITIQECL